MRSTQSSLRELANADETQQLVITPNDSSSKLCSEAHATVARSLEVARALREDNDHLKEAYELLALELSSIVERNEALEQEKTEANQSKTIVEAECQALYRRWTNELKVQSERFKEIEVEMVPASELELLRERLIIEMEGPHRQRLNDIQQQMEDYRSQLQASSRELRLLQAQLTHHDNEHSLRIHNMDESFRSSIERLKKENKILQEKAEDMSQADDLRKTERANADLSCRITDLQQQVVFYKTRSTEAMVEHERRQMEMMIESTHLKQELAVRKRGLNMLQVVNASVNKDLEGAKKENEKLKTHATQIQEMKQRLENELRAKEEQISGTRRQIAKREAEIAAGAEAKVSDLRQKLEETRSRYASDKEDLEQTLERLEGHTVEHQNAAIRMRANHTKQQQQMVTERAEIDQQIYQLETAASTQMQKYEEDMHTLQQDLERERSTVRSIGNSNTVARQKLDRVTEEVSILEGNAGRQAQEYKEVCHELKQLQTTHRDMTRKMTEMAADVKKLNSQRKFLEEQLSSQSNDTENRRLTHLEQIQQLSSTVGAMQNEMCADNTQLTKTLGQMSTSHELQIKKLKSEKLKYKKLAMLSKMQLETMTTDYSQVKTEAQKWRSVSSKKLESLRSRLRDVERERDEFQFKLSLQQVTRET